MRLNLRSKNTLPKGGKIDDFASGYFSLLFEASKKINTANLNKAFQMIESAVQSERLVYVAGNGGSAAISEHLCCDWTKGTSHKSHKSLKTHSLMSNTAILTALSNDLSYEEAISEQVLLYCKPKDVLVLISSSGNSPNILNALKAAKKMGVSTIGLTGFDGGKLKKQCDISLHVPVNNYGVVEDCHQSLMHIIAQYMGAIRDGSIKRGTKK